MLQVHGGFTSVQGTQAGWQSSPYVAQRTNFTFELPRHQLEKGLTSFGSRARARRAVHKLVTGQPMIIAYLGGSITM